MMPIRIQRKRTKGWRMPGNTVCVSRGTAYGNPYRVGPDCTPTQAIAKYADLMLPYTHRPPRNTMHDFYVSEANLVAIVNDLRGKNVCCWCPIECTTCKGAGGNLSMGGILQDDGSLDPTHMSINHCKTCGGSGRQPCHGDWLIRMANETEL